MRLHIHRNRQGETDNVPRWKHATLPQYSPPVTPTGIPIPNGKRLHLFWVGPIFAYTVPREKKGWSA